jgi:hypothetical protein
MYVRREAAGPHSVNASHGMRGRTNPLLWGWRCPRQRRRIEAEDLIAKSMRSILIVDDDAEYRRGLKVVLESKSYAVLEAGHGREAMSILAQSAIDLVITDIVGCKRTVVVSMPRR